MSVFREIRGGVSNKLSLLHKVSSRSVYMETLPLLWQWIIKYMVMRRRHIHDVPMDTHLPLLVSLSPLGSILVMKFIYQAMVSGGFSLFILY